MSANEIQNIIREHFKSLYFIKVGKPRKNGWVSKYLWPTKIKGSKNK